MSNLARSDGGNEELKRLEGTTMTANQNGKIITGDVKDQLAFIPLILINLIIPHIEMLQNITDKLNGRISDNVDLLVRVTVFLRFLRKVAVGLKLIDGFDKLFLNFFAHFFSLDSNLPSSNAEGEESAGYAIPLQGYFFL